MAATDLRPMTLGEVLDRTFTLYRERFLLFVGIVALPDLLLLVFKFGALLLENGNLKGLRPGEPSPALIGGILASAGLLIVLTFILVGIAQAATIWAVSEIYLGRPASVRSAYSNSAGRVLAVLGTIFLVGLATGVGFIFLIIPGIYVACRLAVTIPVVMVEQESPVAAMERSWQLTEDNAGQMFLLLLLVFVISYAVNMVFQFPVIFFTIAATIAKHPLSMGVTVYSYIAEFIGQVLAGPIGTISASLMYYNLRVRKEGFDIQHLFSSLGGAPVTETPGI
jgi:hypothetical protein